MSRSARAGWKFVALLSLLSLLVAACSKEKKPSTAGPTGGETVTIAFVGPLTGENANLGINIRDAMKVAIQEANDLGEGPRIAMKEYDTAGDPAQASTLKDQIVAEQSVIGIVGPTFSGETKALIPSFEQAGLVMISASATNKDLPTVVPNSKVFHRVIADDALQAAGITEYLVKEAPRSVAYVHDNTEYGKGLTDEVEKLATGRGIVKATSAVVDPKAQDFSSTVNSIKAANPTTVFYGGYYAEAGRLKKQLTDAGITASFLSGDGSLDPGFVTAAGHLASEGARLTCPCNLALESSKGPLKKFYDSFRVHNQKDPGLYSPEGYDATMILIEGIKKMAAKERPKLLEYVEALKSYEGISKKIEFAPDGNLVSKQFFVFQVLQGKITPLQEIQVA